MLAWMYFTIICAVTLYGYHVYYLSLSHSLYCSASFSFSLLLSVSFCCSDWQTFTLFFLLLLLLLIDLIFSFIVSIIWFNHLLCLLLLFLLFHSFLIYVCLWLQINFHVDLYTSHCCLIGALVWIVQQWVRVTRKKISSVWKGKRKYKKKVHQHLTVRSIGESRKRSKNIDLFGWTSGKGTITDQFGEGCHKYIRNIFVGQQSALRHYYRME